MTDALEQVWSDFCSHYDLGCEVSEKWLKIARECYESRKCYDLQYLNAKLEHFQSCRVALARPYSVSAALIFQSIHYDTKSSDNIEKCIEKFGDFLTESAVTVKDAELKGEVTGLIELSVTSSTDEHNMEGVFGKSDQHYFLDINFTHLASDWKDYLEFSLKTRTEYEFLNDSAYKSLRLKVLQSFLLIPNIFATEEFRSKYEEKARANIKKEIEEMK